jgi:hypothetical protein
MSKDKQNTIIIEQQEKYLQCVVLEESITEGRGGLRLKDTQKLVCSSLCILSKNIQKEDLPFSTFEFQA